MVSMCEEVDLLTLYDDEALYSSSGIYEGRV